MHIVTNPDFHINIENEHIILHGSVDESAGVMLRGAVVLNCHETTKVRSISLKFVGKAKVNWTEGKKLFFRNDEMIKRKKKCFFIVSPTQLFLMNRAWISSTSL